MGAHNETCTDMQFIQLWGELQSATKVAKHLGVNLVSWKDIQLRKLNNCLIDYVRYSYLVN